MSEWRQSERPGAGPVDHDRLAVDASCGEERVRDAATRARLERTIEDEIIPRLMMMREAASRATPKAARVREERPDEQVAQLARLLIARNGEAAVGYVEGLRERGVPLEDIYLELLVPTARLLGEMWSADFCDFTDVTIGLWRMQQLVHRLSPAFQNDARSIDARRRLLLVPNPGEQHTFGLILVAEFFRRAGWDVCDELVESREHLLALLERESFAVVGLSASCSTQLDALADTIRCARARSANRHLKVIVGGAVFLDRPALVRRVGADATANDGLSAIAAAESLLEAKREARS
jgi:methanogenic corrinoid protein MtbC1